MGSVSPLLALADMFRETRGVSTDTFFWIGTRHGPEAHVVELAKIPFQGISSAKWRRYVSLTNLFDVFQFIRGYQEAKKILKRFQPDVVLTAGGYVCVPVARAAYRLKIPHFVHQQDIVPGLANRIMAKHATRITVTFSSSLAHFPQEKTVLTGNPIRQDILHGSKDQAREIFGFKDDVPVILCMGGGTGALALNQLIVQSLVPLTQRYQILHLTGALKEIPPEQLPILPPFQQVRYKQYGFLDQEMKHALALADLVICRAGISTATELVYLGKPTVMIPIPNSHQVANAKWFYKQNAVVMLEQKTLTAKQFIASIDTLFVHPWRLSTLSHNIKTMMKLDAGERILKEVERVVGR